MDKKDLERIEEKIDKIDEKLESHGQILAVNTEILKEHQRRSLALEEQVNLNKVELENQLEPVKRHVEFINFLAKLLLGLGAFIASTATILKHLGII